MANRFAITVGVALAAIGLGAAAASASTFSNTAPIAIPAAGSAGAGSPYPSVINVNRLPATSATQIRVTLRSIFHTFPDDIDALLVGPSGNRVALMLDRCGNTSTPLTGQTFTFDDGVGQQLPDAGPCASGTYLPSFTAGSGALPLPAPQSDYLGTIWSLSDRINGAWQLWIADDTGGDTGLLAGGWSLELLPSGLRCSRRPATVGANVGTAGNDVLIGTPAADIMVGLDGDDTIRGLGGNDVICGSDGKDTLKGGPGKDLLRGEAGKDKLQGQGGKDFCSGGFKRDTAKGCEKERTL